MAAALGFWVVTVFALEALASALVVVLPPRWSLGLILTFTALDPAELVRTVSVTLRGQAWAYGPAFAEVRDALGTGLGLVALGALALGHLLLPGGLAVLGSRKGGHR